MPGRFESTRWRAAAAAVAASVLAAAGAAAESRDIVGYVGTGVGLALDVSDDVPGTAAGPAVDLRGGLIVQPVVLEVQSEYAWQEIDSDSVHTIFTGLNMMYTPFYHLDLDEESLLASFDPYVLGGLGVGWGRAEGGDFDIDGTGVGRFWRVGAGTAFRLSESFDLDFRSEWVRSSRGSIEGLDRFRVTFGIRYVLAGEDEGSFYKY